MPVETGSPIDNDDAALDAFSMRELIGAPLRAAIDDLVLAAVSLDKWKAVRGFAHPTLVRSAITGAATAIWIMDPDVTVRRLRALRMSYQIAKAELTFVRGVPENWNGPAAGPTAEQKLDRVRSREKKLQRVVDNAIRLGFSEREVRDKPTDTMMVEESAKRLPPGSFHCAADEHLLTEWRLLSGRAHGLIWPIHYSDATVVRSSDARFITAPIAMSLDRMLGSVHNAITLINCAVDHYSELIKAPV
ncbi:hypothetical protein O6072_02630 [Mycolicibacterium neoaurum]|uniref:hypothetical protein n=1 Tax=Mycolicibacterium neoaurum TaxID=1795 RepID=UPI00248B7D6E|nr:hypothetical protein [Mycolicibacterium neoaurum]WBP94906.1 hypothetical protein O7W24_01485 [Mycolicibacterium neoaurum]WBS08795.1 hypothetical protein O6072_02630 [Mycolicibacterium neoaurum]